MTKSEYFKNRINWKFFNYLKDHLTKYEDGGNLFSININVEMNDREYLIIYLYNIKYSDYVDGDGEMSEGCIGGNITYTIQASVSNSDKFALNKFCKRVESKCDFYGKKSNIYVEIKPK